MIRPALEVADVVRRFAGEFRQTHAASFAQLRVLRGIAACRTSDLGGHVQECDGCQHRRVAYNSCRNRHCPKCQSGERMKWMASRAQEVLPVPYFHLVFTLPHQLGPLALQNKRCVYGLLFRVAAETIQQIASDPEHLGAKVGFLSVLHTWGQNLMHHPHLHVVVPGGGISPDGSTWVSCKRSRRGKVFFLPVRILSKVFRGKFIAGLKRAFTRGELEFHGNIESLSDRSKFEGLLNEAVRTDWVVYAKRPFGGPEQVLKYLARYTHRVAISNRRLLRANQDSVTFRYKDYANGNESKTMTLKGTEFLRRFLLHVLPKGFTRIRHYGLLANRDRAERLEHCRQLLKAKPPESGDKEPQIVATASESDLAFYCPKCKVGRMIVIDVFEPAETFSVPRPHFHLAPSRRKFSDTS